MLIIGQEIRGRIVTRRSSFSGFRPGVETPDQLLPDKTAQYTRFLHDKADRFLIEHQLPHLHEHAALDFLIAYRNSLTVGMLVPLLQCTAFAAEPIEFRDEAGVLHEGDARFDDLGVRAARSGRST